MVSEATVSRVINNSPLVHQRTRNRVMEVITKLGYTPNAAARNLSRNKTDTVGVLFHQMSSGFFALVMSGIDKSARQGGYHILCEFTHFEPEDPRHTFRRMFDEVRVDGMIVLDPSFNLEFIEELKRYKSPIVFIQRELSDPEFSSISIENRDGAYQAMKYLLSLDYRDLLVVKGPAGAQDAQLRLKGCEDALREVRGATCRYIIGDYSPADALAAFRKDRLEHGLPRAIFALNDAMALSVLKELRDTGVKVPEQVAIIGFDGIDCTEYVGLTTVETPMMDLGEGAVKLFLKRIESPDAPGEHVRLPTKLVIRGTCGGKPL